MKKLDAYLHWKQCKGIFSLFWPMHHSNPPPIKHTTFVTSWSTWILKISSEYFIVHTPWNDHLELPTHTTTKNSDLVHTLPECNFTICRIYVLPSIWNTAPMNILFHARWSNHPEIIMHTNSQNLALCRLKFFFLPKQKSSKEEMKQGGKKYLSTAKITIHILLALVNSLSCICSDTSIV